MKGVVVDFYTLYDPIALTGAILTYIPFYGKIYVSRHSFLLEATSCTGRGWVPISGLKLVEESLDSPRVDWLRNWSKRKLNGSEDTLVTGNLYASFKLIKESMKAGIIEVLPNDEELMQIGGRLLKEKDLPTGILYDGMMAFGEGEENGFYLSPDLGHGYQLGAGVIFGAKDSLRFSTSNPEIRKSLEYLLAPEILNKHVESVQDQKASWKIQCDSNLVVEDVFELLGQNEKTSRAAVLLKDIEQLNEDVMYFAPEVSLDYLEDRLTLSVELNFHVLKFAS